MTERIVIAGASGFIGQYLVRAFEADGAQVCTIGRRGNGASASEANWGNPEAITALINGSDLVINLAGKSVNCRYTRKNRAEILRSRVETTRELAEAIRRCETPPPLWINSSTATIYRHADDREMDEISGEIGTGFSVSIARAWEAALFAGELESTRRIALRLAIVFGIGGALSPLRNLARFGLGGPQLDGRWFTTGVRRRSGTFHQFRVRGGRQRFSWVHVADVLGVIRYLREHSELAGAINVSSPEPADNRSVMRSLRRSLGRFGGLPAPRWLLEMGMLVIRSETELVLKSRWVVPRRLTESGFVFEFPALDPALRQIEVSRKMQITRR